MTRVVKVLTAAAKNKWKQRARRRQLRQRTGYDGPVNLPIGNYRSPPRLLAPCSNLPSPLITACVRQESVCSKGKAPGHEEVCSPREGPGVGPDVERMLSRVLGPR